MAEYQRQGLRYQPWALPPLPGESEAALNERRDLAYFEWQLHEIVPDWWAKFPPLDLTGARVLDLGCGHGSLVVDIAQKGAAQVVGIDLDRRRVDFARRHVEAAFPEVWPKVEFHDRDIATIAGTFDIVVTKDTFEHVQDLGTVMRHVHRLLKPGGLLVAGFAPLYYSPFGDHGLFWGRRFLPWLPVVLPEPLLLKLRRWRTGESAASIAEIGLNKLTPAQFRALLAGPDWTIRDIRYNPGDKPLLAPMRVLRQIPPLERFFTTGIHALIAKSGAATGPGAAPAE